MASLESGESADSTQTSTPEYRTMRKCYVKLIDLLKSSIDTVGDALFAEEHISEDLRDTLRMNSVKQINKAREVVDCLMDRVKHRPSVYSEFVLILENQGPWAKLIVDELNTCYQSFKQPLVGKIGADKASSEKVYITFEVTTYHFSVCSDDIHWL